MRRTRENLCFPDVFRGYRNGTLGENGLNAMPDLVPFVQFKNVRNTDGGVLLLAKLQAQARSLQLY